MISTDSEGFETLLEGAVVAGSKVDEELSSLMSKDSGNLKEESSVLGAGLAGKEAANVAPRRTSAAMR